MARSIVRLLSARCNPLGGGDLHFVPAPLPRSSPQSPLVPHQSLHQQCGRRESLTLFRPRVLFFREDSHEPGKFEIRSAVRRTKHETNPNDRNGNHRNRGATPETRKREAAFWSLRFDVLSALVGRLSPWRPWRLGGSPPYHRRGYPTAKTPRAPRSLLQRGF